MKATLTCALLLAVLCVCESVKFGQLCSGNPTNRRRTSDNFGEGRFGARRFTNNNMKNQAFIKEQEKSSLVFVGLSYVSWLSSFALKNALQGQYTMCLHNENQIAGRTHQGLDIVCSDGADVYAPFDVDVNGALRVYPDPTNVKVAINKGINLQGGGLCFKLFYVNPVQISGRIAKGQKIGTMLPMQTVYRGITSHVHVQLCDRTDPTRYF